MGGVANEVDLGVRREERAGEQDLLQGKQRELLGG